MIRTEPTVPLDALASRRDPVSPLQDDGRGVGCSERMCSCVWQCRFALQDDGRGVGCSALAAAEVL